MAIEAKHILFKRTHGLSKTRLYGIWAGMKNRCYNKNTIGYKYYGAKGISICSQWKNSLEVFWKWSMNNGYKDWLTIDRINSDGNYEPDNCRWTTTSVQAHNRKVLYTSSSGYIGVYSPKHTKKYVAKIGIRGKVIHLGTFNTARAAAIKRETYIIDNNLPHTKNFVT